MAAHDQPTACEAIPYWRNYSEGEHHRLDRPFNDHVGQPKQRISGTVSGIHDPSEDAKSGQRCHRLHSGEWNICADDVSRTTKVPSSGRRGELPEAHLLLAKRATPRQVQRDLERSQSIAVTTSLLTIRDIRKAFGAREVLRGVSLDVAEGEFLPVRGESGSGKAT